MLPTVNLLFLAFATALLLGAWSVVLAKNPMHAVLGMIFTFVNAAGLMILHGAEFLGLLLIMVYVGAIAVMFLFVLMTIDVDFAALKTGLTKHLPLAALTTLSLGGLLITALNKSGAEALPNIATTQADAPENTLALGQVLFTQYALPFQAAGLILLTAMVGAIVLTHRRRPGVRRQNISQQIFRKKDEAMLITLPKTGQG
ncbi:MAG: NADH:ubiquinone oxidoreductase subunit J, partial [Alphaproteobacteria bacterium CG_4_10_14_0_8_um_filter_53_9]